MLLCHVLIVICVSLPFTAGQKISVPTLYQPWNQFYNATLDGTCHFPFIQPPINDFTGEIQFGCMKFPRDLLDKRTPEKTTGVCSIDPEPDTLEWKRGKYTWGLCTDETIQTHEDFLEASHDSCPCVKENECPWSFYVLGLKKDFSNPNVVSKINKFVDDARCDTEGEVHCCVEANTPPIMECVRKRHCATRAFTALQVSNPFQCDKPNHKACLTKDIERDSSGSSGSSGSFGSPSSPGSPDSSGSSGSSDSFDPSDGRWLPNGTKEECGRKLNYQSIAGGTDAKLGDYPYMAILGRRQGSTTAWSCGGSLINGRYVLTAAHCMFDWFGNRLNPSDVWLGDWKISDFATVPPIKRKPEKVIVHEGYNKNRIQDGYDIALIRLDEPVPVDDGLAMPVCLPWKSNNPGHSLEKDDQLTVTGWGTTLNPNETEVKNADTKVKSDILQTVNLRYIDDDTCKNSPSVKKESPWLPNSSQLLCAGGYEGKNQGACRGDSGGPLVRKKDRRSDQPWYQVGIVSFATGKCGDFEPIMYTRVTTHLEWIKGNLER